MEDVNIGLPVEHQYATGYQARQPLAESTLRRSPISRSQGSPSRRSGNPVAQVPRPHPGSGGAGHSFPLPGALAADSSWT
ncbi:hypothetical protein M407DRAFT_98717 [Tulasnella calospora MUT 4182]|uniref:Uncharacterized protein n=1 Tax=Tulasnella calospora MUT 4182 TaxID=1051891 RepID=A0A0C3QGL1_9AGAM|nr:hypothetical protein M407DRAFT_98717 [Tulasnella calospora MUT 4182]